VDAVIDVAAVRTNHPIATIVEQSGVPLRPAGRRLVGRCPFHPDREPSFSVYPETQSYFCFGCSAGGDVIDFVARRDHLDFRDAVAHLGVIEAPGERHHGAATERWSPMTERRRYGADSPARNVHTQRDRATLAVIDTAAEFYHERLRCSRPACAYLSQRGITVTTAFRERLGYGAAGLARHLRGLRLEPSIAEAVGLLRGERDSLADRIVVPDLEDGRATWLTGRAVGDIGPRYLNLRLPTPLLGAADIGGAEAIVTEGPFDWLTARQWGLPALALLGTHVSDGIICALRRFRRVYLVLDADTAGQRATRQLQDALGEAAVPVALPPGTNDLGELASRPGGRAFVLAALRAGGYGEAYEPGPRSDPVDGRRAAWSGAL